MATQIQKLLNDWLEWRLATARLRAVSMNAATSTAKPARLAQERPNTDQLAAPGLPNGNLCPGQAV